MDHSHWRIVGVIGYYILKAIQGESMVESSVRTVSQVGENCACFWSDWLLSPERVLWRGTLPCLPDSTSRSENPGNDLPTGASVKSSLM